MIDRSFRGIVEDLAARRPTPGGGAAAALALSMGVALGHMAVVFSIRRKAREADTPETVEDPDALLRTARDRLAAIVDTSLPMAAEDCAAYDRVSAAFKLPKDSDEAKATRRREVQAGLVCAMEAPLRVLLTARDALEILANVADHANPNLISDLATGASLLRAGSEGAALNVRINASSLDDRSRAESTLEQAAATEEDLRASYKKVRDTAMAVLSS